MVADVTHADANVMYKLGLRHAFRKHTIEIGDEKYNKVPSDIQGIGLINYNFNALEDFKNSITNRITKIDKSNKPSSPISDDVPYPIFMISGQQEVFDFLRKNRDKTYEFYGMWCYSHFKVNDLVNYFSEERSLNLPHRTRLINTLTVDQNLIREHIRNSENDIRAGNYLIYSTSESSHEIVICHMHRDDVDDVELAIQLIPHSANKTVDMAIFSYDNHFVEKMKSRYDNSKGESFLPGKHFDNDLENWLYNSRHNMIANLEKIIEVEKNKYKQFLVKS